MVIFIANIEALLFTVTSLLNTHHLWKEILRWDLISHYSSVLLKWITGSGKEERNRNRSIQATSEVGGWKEIVSYEKL